MRVVEMRWLAMAWVDGSLMATTDAVAVVLQETAIALGLIRERL
jgi:hypothetical protein